MTRTGWSADPADPQRAPRWLGAAAPRAAGAMRPALVHGAAGFVLGALFWHVVGFWGFVADLVHKGPAVGDGAAMRPDKAAGSLAGTTQAGTTPLTSAAASGGCTSVLRQAGSSLIVQQPCASDMAELPTYGKSRRTDLAAPAVPLAQHPRAWAVEVNNEVVARAPMPAGDDSGQ